MESDGRFSHHPALFVWLLLIYIGPTYSAVLICEQSDPAGDTTPAYCDIVAARVFQVDSWHYQLEIEVAGSIPPCVTEYNWVRYIWYLDADQSRSTGQGQFGSEFNVRALESDERGSSYATIDVVGTIPAPGGTVTKFVDERTVVILLPFDQIAGQTTFNWACRTVLPSASAKDEVSGSSPVRPCQDSFPASTPHRVVVEENLVLRSGRTSAVPAVYIQNQFGEALPVHDDDIIEFDPYYDRVDVRDGQLQARPGEWVHVPVAVRINGRVSDNQVEVMPGSAFITPAVLHLDVAEGGVNTGLLTVQIVDAYGTPVPLEGRTIEWPEAQTDKISLHATDSPASIMVRAEKFGDGGTVAMRAEVDGWDTRVHAHIRITSQHYDLPEFDTYVGDHVVFTLPGSLGFSPQGGTLGEMMARYQVVDAADAAWAWQYHLVGCYARHAERQFFNGLAGDETASVCGGSGNRISLGFGQGRPDPHSCIQVHATGEPHWSVMFHECGHNATGANSRLNVYLRGSSALGAAFGEAEASICGLYAMCKMIENPRAGWLAGDALASLNSCTSYGGFCKVSNGYLAALTAYEQDPDADDFDKVTPHVVDGMLVSLCNAYGWEKLRRLFSIFLPRDDAFSFDPKYHHPSFVAACFSAAFEADLLEVCRDRWGFQVDEDFYWQILPELQRLARLRDMPGEVMEADLTGDGRVDQADFAVLADRWNESSPAGDVAPTQGDGFVDLRDLNVLASEWLQEASR